MFAYEKILDINLSSGRIVQKEIDTGFARKYIGGMGFSCKILFDEIGTDVTHSGPAILLSTPTVLTGPSALRRQNGNFHPFTAHRQHRYRKYRRYVGDFSKTCRLRCRGSQRPV